MLLLFFELTGKKLKRYCTVLVNCSLFVDISDDRLVKVFWCPKVYGRALSPVLSVHHKKHRSSMRIGPITNIKAELRNIRN